MVHNLRNQTKANRIQTERNTRSTVRADSPPSESTRFHRRQDSTTTACEKRRLGTCPINNPMLLAGEAAACGRPGALVNTLESAWREGVCFGRVSKTDEHLIGTPKGVARRRAVKRRVESRCWNSALLNTVVSDPWQPTPVTRQRPLPFCNNRESILMGPLPRAHFTLPEDLVAATSRETTHQILRLIAWQRRRATRGDDLHVKDRVTAQQSETVSRSEALRVLSHEASVKVLRVQLHTV